MVDSIRPKDRIGVVAPGSRLRPLERRQRSRQESQQRRDDDAAPSEEEALPLSADGDGGRAENSCAPPRDEEARDAKPGRCIDVRI